MDHIKIDTAAINKTYSVYHSVLWKTAQREIVYLALLYVVKSYEFCKR